MVPVTAEDTVLDAPFFGLLYHPFYKAFAAIVVVARVIAHAIMDVGEYYCVCEIYVFSHITA